MKILHILDHYKPHFSGYVFRTSYILKHQRANGLNPVCITSPKQGGTGHEMREIDGIKIYPTQKCNFGNIPFLRENRLMNCLRKKIEEIINIEKPDIIHAHSPSLNGVPALKAGRKYGIPVVYEVRAFWEDAAVDHRTFKENSLKYRISRFIETRLLKNADAVFTISDAMKKEMSLRGIPEKKIEIIPNGVDIEQFSVVPYDNALRFKTEMNMINKKVIGFIGSFYHYEGIDILIEAYSEMIKKNKNIILMLVGDGPEYATVHETARNKGLNGRVIFTGKVPHNDIKRYYSVMDVLVYPRRSMRLTELVTPLKPLEAMALGKIVAGSDVGGIRELIKDGKNGVLFKPDSAESLSVRILELLSDSEKMQTLSQGAVDYIRRERSWDKIVRQYIPVYKRLAGSN